MADTSELYSFTDFPTRYLARVTIELLTPLHLGAGSEWREADAGVTRDANGLPAIPGSSLAGVFRHAHAREFSGATAMRKLKEKKRDGDWSTAPKEVTVTVTEDLFGIPSTPTRQGAGSRLNISWAKIHDARNVPVDSIRPPDSLREDPVLSAAKNPTLRDHVRINHRGVAENRGKFDELAVHAGNRFTFEMELTGTKDDQSAWNDLLSLLTRIELRLGGKSRRGFGAFQVVSCQTTSFSLHDPADFAEYARHDCLLETETTWEQVQGIDPSPSVGITELRLQVEPRHLWMFGGGFHDQTDADSAPVKDIRIHWTGRERGASGVPRHHYYIPGSHLKGALSHRTFFHLCALCGHYADSPDAEGRKRADELLKTLFGSLKEKKDSGNGPGYPGRIWLDDLYLDIEGKEGPPELRLQHHVRIDPFTGGASDAMLFNDLPLATPSADFPQPPFPIITIRIDERNRPGVGELDSLAKKALLMTLDDLCEGRLSVGAHGGRGYGFLRGAYKVG